MPSTATLLFAQAIPGAQAYRFEVTNGTAVNLFEATTNSFSLSNWIEELLSRLLVL